MSAREQQGKSPSGAGVRTEDLERIHLLRTVIALGGEARAIDIADRANQECDDDAFDDLPEISRRAIGQKLSGLEKQLLLTSRLSGGRTLRERVRLWSVTPEGRAFAYVPLAPGSDDRVIVASCEAGCVLDGISYAVFVDRDTEGVTRVQLRSTPPPAGLDHVRYEWMGRNAPRRGASS